KEARFLRPRDRHRSRIVHRRRRILAGLAEAATLALLIGLFPLFHGLLVAAAILGMTLLLYTALLVRIRMRENERARRARARRARSLIARPAPLRERVAAGAPNGAPAAAAAAAAAAESRPAAEAYGFDGYGGGWTGYP